MFYLKKSIHITIFILFFFSYHAFAQSDKEIEKLFDMTFEELMNIKVITASKQKQKVSEAPAIISIITEEQIRERGYDSVGEALKAVPGVYLLDDHFQYNLGVRGINGGMRAWSRIVKVMIDNQPVSFRVSTENWLGVELIPINVVKRIEIVRGPSSALYGANAFLGVINIITKSYENIEGGRIAGSIGSLTTRLNYGGELLLGKKIDSVGFVFAGFGGYSDRSGLSVKNIPNKAIYDTDDKSENDISNPRSLFGRITYVPNSIGRLSLDFNYQYVDKYGEFQDWGVLTHNNRISLHNFYIRGKFYRELWEKIALTTSVSYGQGESTDKEHLAINQQGLADWMSREVGYRGFDITSEILYSFNEQNSLTFGFDFTRNLQNLQTYYRNYHDKPKQPTGTVPDDTTFVDVGVYFQTILYPFHLVGMNRFNSLGVTLGLRYDAHNMYEDVINCRIGGVFPITDKIHAKLLYGTSFKAPASVQLYTTILVPGGVIGNPDLEPEKAKTLEMAFGGQFKHFNFDIIGFYNIIEDKVELVRNVHSGTANIQADNVAEISSYGIETCSAYQYGDVSGYINFSYQNSMLEKYDPILGNLSLDTKLYPKYMLKFGNNWRMPKYFINLNLEGRWIDYRLASNQNTFWHDPIYRVPYKLDPYLIFDLTISSFNLHVFDENETNIRLKIRNLFDEAYYYPGFKDFDIPGVDRNFVFEINQAF